MYVLFSMGDWRSLDSPDSEVDSCRIALLLLFHSTSTIINRPCLCRERMGDQSSTSKNRNRGFANNRVVSAQHIDLILNEPESTILHQGVTWWMLLRHLKRALTVILLALAFRAEYMPADAAIRYVVGMSVDDLNRQVQMPKREWMAAGAMTQAPKIGALVQKKTCPQSKGFSFMWHCPHKWKVVVEGGSLRTTKASLTNRNQWTRSSKI